MPHQCPDCGVACDCTPGDAHVYHCTHEHSYDEAPVVEVDDDADLEDDDAD